MITLRNQQFQLKFGFATHLELQEQIKKSGQDSKEFLSEKNYPIIIQLGLKHCLPDVTIEEILEALELLNYPEINELMNPIIKFYTPNAVQPKS